MARAVERLSAADVAKLIKDGKPGLHADGAGLGLKISPSGAASWSFRYTLAGKAREMGLGAVHTVGLGEARKRAKKARLDVHDGVDLVAQKHATKTSAAAAMTFSRVAEMYLAAHAPSWRNDTHRAQWKQTLADYILPVLGEMNVAAVDTGAVMRVIEPLWHTKPETASRVRGRIEAILSYASAREWRSGMNPAQWRGHLETMLPARAKVRAVVHHAALPWQSMPQFMAALRAREGVAARGAEFCILTAARSGEAREARWSEIDLDVKLWTIPASRMKGGKAHRVPLSDAAVAVLHRIPRGDRDAHVFPGMMPRQPLSDVAISKIVKLAAGLAITLHGFRSTFRDWTAEATVYPRELAEKALAHTLESKVEAAYQRADMLAKRRDMMNAWAEFCSAHG